MSFWEEVDTLNYYREVLGNIVSYRKDKEQNVVVRFGTTGKGVSPHYQIEVMDDTKHCINGLNHQTFVETPEDQFDRNNLSEKVYTYPDVQQLLKSAINRSKQK